MTDSQVLTISGKQTTALDELMAFMRERQKNKVIATDFEAFEQEARRRFAAAEAEFVAQELARLDVDAPAVEIDGVPHHRVLQCPQTYMTAAGTFSIPRTLYSTRQDGERAVCPMELRAGIVEGYFTPLAAKNAAWAVAHLTPGECETMFGRLGGMCPSKASLDRLPKALSARWEVERQDYEKRLRDQEVVPAEAVTVGVSLDGVLVPMKDGHRKEKRAARCAKGGKTKGPTGYSEASCGTLTFFDAVGSTLQTRRLARMPEMGKATLKASLALELAHVLAQRPDLRVVTIADGAKDNWSYLSLLPEGREGYQIVDFFHAAEHLADAMVAVHGEGTVRFRREFEKHRHILRHESEGVEMVIRHLRYLVSKHRRNKRLVGVLKYFRNRRHRMRYATFARKHLPIGSGIVEAACKTLVTQRLKRSGMRWRHDGGQAILTLRSLEQSDRFDRAWHMLASTYIKDVRLPENIVDIASRRPR
jgi:hypothetical protein